jgi:CubicO group peptidase (beta-lactamase class C family)
MENYFNNHTATTNWYWASAGKTLTSTITGIAEQEGLIDSNAKVSKYIGTSWTSETVALITCKKLLSMTSGIEDIANGDGVSPSNLKYKADATLAGLIMCGKITRRNKLKQVENMVQLFQHDREQIGMDGSWLTIDNNMRLF